MNALGIALRCIGHVPRSWLCYIIAPWRIIKTWRLRYISHITGVNEKMVFSINFGFIFFASLKIWPQFLIVYFHSLLVYTKFEQHPFPIFRFPRSSITFADFPADKIPIFTFINVLVQYSNSVIFNFLDGNNVQAVRDFHINRLNTPKIRYF